ncbi:MAG: CHAT domain-containing protein, partial [Desulfobacterales bacterium]
MKPKLIKYKASHRHLFSVRSRWSHFSLLIYLPVVVLIFACLVASCETGRQTISLDEAKQISLQFSDASFVPPPRSIKDLVPEFSVYTGDELLENCVSKPQRSLEEISKMFVNAPPKSTPRKHIALLKMAIDEMHNGNFSRSIELNKMSLAALPSDWKGARSDGYAELSKCYVYVGDFKSAKSALNQARYWYSQKKNKGSFSQYQLYHAEGLIDQMKGNLDRAEQHFMEGITVFKGFPVRKLESIIRADLVENLMLQGRLLEAEAVARELVHDFRFIYSRSEKQYCIGRALLVLSKVLFKQGRYSEAKYVAEAAINIYTKAGAACSSVFLNLARQTLAKCMIAQERWQEAIAQFDEIDDGMKNERDAFKTRFGGDVDWSIALLATGQVTKAMEKLETGLKITSEQFGQNHYHTAVLRGVLAAAHLAGGDKKTALESFSESVPHLLKQFRKAGSAAFTRFTKDPHLTLIIESYMNLLSDIHATALEATMGIDAVETSFTLADFVRAHSVQRAVSSSCVRYGIKDAELADLIRREQDVGKRLEALYSALTNAVAQQRTDKNPEVIRSLKEQISKLGKARLAFIKEIDSRFPKYAQLIDPVPPSLKEAKASLNPGESLISIYIGRDQSFVWAVPYEGQVMFTTVSLGKKEIDTMVARIRSTLEPNAKRLGEIPQFDLETAYALFKAFFEPVRQAWKNAKSLLVVPHGALSYLPLSLLPTEQIKLPADKDVWFENYKRVPWLVRSHAVTVLPSVSTLILLRAMPQAARAQLPFVGFGDPYFNEQQALAAAKSKKELQTASFKQPGDYVLRGLSIQRVQTDQLDSAQIEVLPRLPETAEEIRGMALAMNADPNRDVFTGAQANEQQVKTMDLSGYKVLAFATHGLAPGDLDGLLQPALALSSPKIAGIDGDGFLTMEEIFGLWLNADWVVLSACNTGAGREQGAEALSGLCRAFFYAGAQALLITNWRVETNSAKALTTNLFKKQAQNPVLTRAEALRQSKLFLIDGVGHIDS